MPFSVSRRDAVLTLLGASCFYLITALVSDSRLASPALLQNPGISGASVGDLLNSGPLPAKKTIDLGLVEDFPETTVISHAPGWTLFTNLYMHAGALIILTSEPASSFPLPPMMTSTGLPGNLTNDAQRIPTENDMAFVTPAQARKWWGGGNERHRVLTVEGTTALFNDPPQFLNHYFHFVAELMFGTWAFLYGAFADEKLSKPASATPDASFTLPLLSTNTPIISRAIFIHSDVDGWRDGPGFNGYFMRAVFPSITIEVKKDWIDRINATSPTNTHIGRAWHFPLALLTDRSAAFRGPITGAHTQRTAAQPWMRMAKQGKIDLIGNWWASLRSALTRYAGGDPTERMSAELEVPDTIVITYIDRQGTRRHLRDADNLALLKAMEELVKRKNVEDDGKRKWEFHDVHAERLSLDEQVQVASRTTIMLGVHGNGLTHLVLMKPTKVSAVVEIFLPGGFARDYEWTSRSLGMTHYSIWNDTSFTHPHEPEIPDYPDGFHGPNIPVHAPTVVKVIEEHVAMRMRGPSLPDNSPVNDTYADEI
ncbi:hypothetical protein MKEN_00365800 [Mycena kentingensis (nom. inval.)]|nr:hypothetical protein MKEN_00365800 [Mycena kentingensis (nom. inval.)]